MTTSDLLQQKKMNFCSTISLSQWESLTLFYIHTCKHSVHTHINNARVQYCWPVYWTLSTGCGTKLQRLDIGQSTISFCSARFFIRDFPQIRTEKSAFVRNFFTREAVRDTKICPRNVCLMQWSKRLFSKYCYCTSNKWANKRTNRFNDKFVVCEKFHSVASLVCYRKPAQAFILFVRWKIQIFLKLNFCAKIHLVFWKVSPKL